MTLNKTILPHESADLFLTDGGLETTLVFLEGFDLPYFAAFDLLKDEKGYTAIKDYYRRYLKIAEELNTGFILESPTWRANSDWIEKIGYPKSAIEEINKIAVQLLADLKSEFKNNSNSVILSGCVGPRGDGYRSEYLMSIEESQKYHSAQVVALSQTTVDLVSALTMNYAEEAVGIALAADAFDLPVVISFTVETDGNLPTGMSLQEAIEYVDARVKTLPIYYMINCAHPSHFKDVLIDGQNEDWTRRIRGVRANSSCKSHVELDESTELDRGNPQELGDEHRRLKNILTHLNVFGGCCGTDEEHVLEIANQVKSV